MILRQTIYNNWKSTWNPLFSYIVNDVTEHNGTSYICILNNTNQEPPDITYWNILASKGDAGTTIASEVTTDESGVSVQDWLDSLQGISHTHSNKITIDKFNEDKYNSLIEGLSTGICHGGILSISIETGTPNTFDISAGSGQIVDSSDCDNPIITTVTWGAKDGLTDNYRTLAPETFIAIDINGNVIQETEWFDNADKRDYIILGTVGHNNLNDLEYVICEPVLTINPNLQFDCFCEALGAFNIEGNVFSSNGHNLKINKSSGKTFDSDANYVNSTVHPSIITTNYEPETIINYNFTESGALWSFAELSQVDPNHYDTLSGLSEVPDGKWTIQTIYQYAPLDYNEMQYGQVYYNSKEDALAQLQQDFVVAPLLEFDTFRGWLVVIKGADDLSDIEQANFITAGKFGMTGGGGGGITTASNVGLGGVGFYLQKVGVNLQFKNINVGSNKITVTNDPTNKEVDIDITEANLTHNNIGSLNAGNYIHLTSAEKTNVNDAVTKRHSQNTDTHLGTVDQNISMNSHKLTGLSVPASNGDSIRATTKITETLLESATDLKHSNSLDHASSGQFNQLVAGEIAGLTEKNTPVDADVILIEDSATSPVANLKKKLSWQYVKSVLKTYFDTLYRSTTSFPEYYYGESLEESQTNSATPTYVNKLTLSIPTPVAGDYILELSCEISNSNANKEIYLKFRDSTTTFVETRIMINNDYAHDAWRVHSYRQKLTLTASAVTYYIDFCRVVNTAWIKNATILLRRVA